MKAIRRIKTKAQGPDNISILLVQKIQDIVIPTIAHIFNSSLITSTFPKIWKQAFVLPLPKVKVPTDPNDYRPISILPAISKALERIVHRQITNYMNEHKLFDKYQSGFRAGHNTSTALLKVTEDIREAIDSNKVTILTLLDLSKAFNSVNFDLLTHKLRNLYLSETAVNWFESYLRERQQCIALEPSLADDLQCYISSRVDRVNDAIDKLNEDIDSIVTWTKKFHLNINPGKTQAIILGHKRQTDAVNHLDISPVKMLVFPYLDYADILLTDLSSDKKTKLQRAHNLCVRFVSNVRKCDHITPSLETIGWLKIDHDGSVATGTAIFTGGVFINQLTALRYREYTQQKIDAISCSSVTVRKVNYFGSILYNSDILEQQ
ncbi:hypothetical protein ANN_03574 [Periplaneta americana]|uniref:Reverse transcriptase domain-containing protein n=1 Tax=Periplaneta americana TaxID=6978 RepID=A0ABQ8U2C5_PERAM|nr:hypothetical protein ANN_03574 [Periplaneta americana]